MDDYCKQAQVFLNKDDEIAHNITVSKNKFSLFKQKITSAFRHAKEAEVPGMTELF